MVSSHGYAYTYQRNMRRIMLENFYHCFYGWFPCFQNIFPGSLTLLNCTAISSNDDDYTFEFNELTSFKILEFVEDVNIEFHVVLL